MLLCRASSRVGTVSPAPRRQRPSRASSIVASMEALRTAAAVLAAACLLAALFLGTPSLACNEAVCASIASKCMLTGSCKCDMTNLTNCTCCKECAQCLDELYEECCYCFKMCPKPERSWTDLAMHSEVEEFAEPEISLFRLLTETPDQNQRWVSYTFPVDHQITSFKHSSTKYKIKIVSVDDSQETDVSDQVTLNCTVAYMSQCRSWGKCSSSCSSMGASGFRWFHNGCCECVGSTCINFGINESRCLRCTEDDDSDISDTELDDALIEYGDDNSNVLK
ncbi:twisted gastrulation protein homolog 1-B-like isoform X2 [Pollicipes pollicipes]|uniref:twisted gastrulation protein homolog 1-B-like isoform X2 n=1 Tax=Pollicipes pollicipes TaxID=41117 RepID=UPI0018857BDE|nr:twisted gastrulation protein homolog 1-B-like isoform X2 [Pollicipes pollicipes]